MRGLRLTTTDEPGFWEVNGYHLYGDPWRERGTGATRPARLETGRGARGRSRDGAGEDLRLDVPDWPGHLPGQHVDVRLTAEDGYQAQRSYRSHPLRRTPLELTVELVEDGEVSPYLTEELAPATASSCAGPSAGTSSGSRLGAGRSSSSPAAREWCRSARCCSRLASDGGSVQATLLHSSRSWEDVIYRDELTELAGTDIRVVHTLTRSQPEGWDGYARRVDAQMLAEAGPARTHVRTSTSADRRRSSRRSQTRSSSWDTIRPRCARSASGRQEAEMDELTLDGNAAAGILQQVFAAEVTTARGTCAGCGQVDALGAVVLNSGRAWCFAAANATRCSSRS